MKAQDIQRGLADISPTYVIGVIGWFLVWVGITIFLIWVLFT